VRTGVLLVVSADDVLEAGVRQAVTNEDLFSVVIAESVRQVAEQVNHAELAAGWVDLDLPGDAGWNAAEWLLGRKPTVRLLMLTSRADQHENSEGIRSDVVFEKNLGAARLLQKTMLMLKEASDQMDQRIARQRDWLRRARPYRWQDIAPMGYRHWGINE
jgi:DNA-binding NarL/FixJ family response regulator